MISLSADAVLASPLRRKDTTLRGFTLMELMIVVAVIAILAAIGFPSYQDSVWKSKRGEGKAAIFRALQSEERYYTANNTYVVVPSPSAVGFSMPVFSGDSLPKSVYTIAANACPGSTIEQCVVVTATTIAGADPKCGSTLSMTSKGVKDSSTSNPNCW